MPNTTADDHRNPGKVEDWTPPGLKTFNELWGTIVLADKSHYFKKAVAGKHLD